ncbi:MAG TPA: alpha/beta hydrolase [Rhodospirillaceae bacterium]|jgi:pimeloyl-ACP methyl ester carboxylesterase|nr:alpha/beta fold hydrolase [Alphaproteobacteria bacterium]HBH26277.1 alpha/beta hydrolase [Rhodospirillaceae bacterium]
MASVAQDMGTAAGAAVRHLERGGGLPRLAYRYTPPRNQNLATAVFLSGYASDMAGAKATHLEQACAQRGQGFLRFDYSGTGLSGGRFADGTLGAWLADARAVVEHATEGRPLTLIGSSMGGWVALLLALSEPRVRAVVTIAAAPDFSQWGVLDKLDAPRKAALDKDGKCTFMGNTYTKALLDEARGHMLLERTHDLATPITMFQGRADAVVPWRTAEKIRRAFPKAAPRLILIEDGDHRLSREADLLMIDRQVAKASALAS